MGVRRTGLEGEEVRRSGARSKEDSVGVGLKRGQELRVCR